MPQADIRDVSVTPISITPTRLNDISKYLKIDFPEDRVIAKKVDSLGGEAALGPRAEYLPRRMWRYAGHAVCYDAATDQAYVVQGAILQKWLQLGGLSWGVPGTDETGTPDGVGRYNHFNSGTASIYWSPSTGAQGIWGAIRTRWAELGWERGALGYPVSDETDFADGGRANEFQHGGIYWWPDTGPLDLAGVAVSYAGMFCEKETSSDGGSNADEPYAMLGVNSPGQPPAAFTTRIYADVDTGDSREDNLEIFRGKPYGLSLGIVVMEHDYGDPNRYRSAVVDAVTAAHAAGTAALAGIPYVGAALAAVAGPLLRTFIPDVADAINDLLGTGDDTIGTNSMTIGAKELVLQALRGTERTRAGIIFKIESPVVTGGGQGAEYRVYFNVRPV